MAIRFSIYFHTQESGEYLKQVVSSYASGQLVAAADLTQLPPPGANNNDIILLDYEAANCELDRWIETTVANPRSPAVFLYSKEISTDFLYKALRLGVKECFGFPITAEKLQEAVNRIPARTTTDGGSKKHPRVITFLGCKGGVGTSFLAANVACLLTQGQPERLLMMDLDLRYAELSYFFNVRPEHTLSELIQNLKRLDSFYFQSIIHSYNEHLYILPAPNRLEEGEAVTPAHLEKILRYIVENLGFRWILLDCCHQLDEITLKALEMSDALVLVSNQSVPALANAKKVLEVLKLLDLKGLNIGVWINAWEKQGDLNLPEIEGFLGRKVSGTLGRDPKQVDWSINEGKPLVEFLPRHPLCRDLGKIAASLSPEEKLPGSNGKGHSWFRRLWSKN